MKYLNIVTLVLLTGCSTFSVTQKDESPERKIVTEVSGVAWFSSAVNITKIKALQTDKTQSFGAGTFGQQGATNFVEALKEVRGIIDAIPKP